MAQDDFNNGRGLESPADDFVAVVPHDSNELAFRTRGLFVGVGGNVTIRNKAGVAVLFKNVPSGAVLPVRTSVVMVTGTAATDIVALR